MSVEILENPITDGESVTGVCAGRMVAYWPSKEEIESGLRAIGNGGYIAAVITGTWGDGSTPIPCAQLRLIVDKCNVHSDIDSKSSCRFSLKPAYGCWTWIPKA